MKYILLLIITAIAFSCDTSEDYFESVNKKPIVKFLINGNEQKIENILDSVKLNHTVEVAYQIKDEEQLDISFSTIQGIEIIQQNYNHFEIKGTQIGKHQFSIQVKDSYNQTFEFSKKIEVFDNLPPVAKIKIKESTANYSKFDRIIDLSESFDKDSKYGGKIDEYEYRIADNSVIQTVKPYLNTIFPGAGTYKIRVRVKDNNNIWSKEEALRVEIIN